MLKVFTAEETVKIIYDNFTAINSQQPVSLSEAAGRVLADDITAGENNPWYIRSTVDGYALKAADTAGAGDTMGALLKNTGKVKMGERAQQIITSGTAVYVPTGGSVPDGADAVVMIEYCEECGDDVYITRSSLTGENLIYIGDDAKEGEVILKAGTRIDEKEIGALAALGITNNIPVRKRLVCGIFSTGDELITPGESVNFDKAQIRDTNSYFTAALVRKWGMECRIYGICKDKADDLTALIKKAAGECDMVLFSGGSSAGISDNSAAAIKAVGGRILVHGIAVKPGKPTIIGIIDGKAVVALPGHPVSAYFVSRQIIKHICLALSGEKALPEPAVNAVLSFNIPSNHGRAEYVPVLLKTGENSYTAEPVGFKSGLITLLARTDGYIVIDRDTEGLSSGSCVSVYLY
jgi:molybdopterin molybdotransferase